MSDDGEGRDYDLWVPLRPQASDIPPVQPIEEFEAERGINGWEWTEEGLAAFRRSGDS